MQRHLTLGFACAWSLSASVALALPPPPPLPPPPLPPAAAPVPAPPVATAPSPAPGPAPETASPTAAPAVAAEDRSASGAPSPPFYDPPAAYQFPPPPPPPPRPEPSLGVSGFFRTYYLTPPVDGVVPHFGATIGGQNGAFMVGYLPSEGLMSLGVEYGRFPGIPLTQGTLAVGILGPSIDAQLFTNFSHDVHVAAGASLLGVGMSSCNVVKGGVFFAQLRAPYIDLWMPLVIDDRGPEDNNAKPMLGLAAGLEAGLVFF